MNEQIEHESFEITNDMQAEWAMRKIREARQERERMAEHYKSQQEAIDRQTEERVSYFTGLLEAYFEQVPHKATKTGIEKYKLPSGELVMKPAGIDYIRNIDVLLGWCKENRPDWVRVKEEPAWAEIKRQIKEDGVLPVGVVPVETPATFDVKVSE